MVMESEEARMSLQVNVNPTIRQTFLQPNPMAEASRVKQWLTGILQASQCKIVRTEQ